MSPDSPTVSFSPGDDPRTRTLTIDLPTAAAGDIPADSPLLAGRYLLGVELARGGMGVIHAARDEVLHRDVAVKLLQARFSPDSNTAKRFVEEACIAGQLQHPGIAPVHDLGTLSDGRPYLAMKLIKGKTLSDLLKDDSLSADEKVSIFGEICQPVAYAHSKGVLHRDLKPANVMVGAFGEVQVMDWGLAKLMRNVEFGMRNQNRDRDEEQQNAKSVIETDRTPDSATQAGSILGTPAYMPPEQAKGEIEKVDARADVFALGAILCELLTGEPPYTGSFDEIRARSIIGDLASAHSRLQGCTADAELRDLAVNCLQADPTKRPLSAKEVGQAIASYRANQVERVKVAERERETAAVMLAESRKRRKVWAGLAATLLIGTIASIALAVWGWQSAKAAKEQALIAGQAKERADAEVLKTTEAKELADAEVVKTTAARREAERNLDRAERLNYANQIRELDRAWSASADESYIQRLHGTRWDYRDWEWNFAANRAVDAERFSTGVGGNNNVTARGSFAIFVDYSKNQRIIWDIAKRQQLRKESFQPGTSSWLIAFSENEQRYVTFDHSNQIFSIRNILDDTVRIIRSSGLPMSTFAISPDGRRLVGGGSERVVVWDIDTGTKLKSWKPHDDSLKLVTFGPTGQVIFTASNTGEIKRWSLDADAARASIGTQNVNHLKLLCSPDGRKLAIVDFQGGITLWDSESKSLGSLPNRGNQVSGAVRWSPDGMQLAIVTDSYKSISVWDVGSRVLVREIKSPSVPIADFAWTSTGREIVGVANDGQVTIFDAEAVNAHRQFGLPTDYHHGVFESANGSELAIVHSTGITIRERATGQPVRTLSADLSRAMRVAQSSDRRRIAVGRNNNTVPVFDLTDHRIVATLRSAEPIVPCVGLSADGRRAYLGSPYASVECHDVDANRRLWTSRAEKTNYIREIHVAPDGREIFAIDGNSRVTVFDAESGVVRREWGNLRETFATSAMSPDGRTLLTLDSQGAMRFWDTGSGQLQRVAPGASAYISAAAYSQDGRRIVAGTHQGNVQIWDAESGVLLLEWKNSENKSRINHIGFSQDGHHLYASHDYGGWHIFDGRPRPRRQLKSGPNTKATAAVYTDGDRSIAVQFGGVVMTFDAKTGYFNGSLDEMPTGAKSTSQDGTRVLEIQDHVAWEVNLAERERDLAERVAEKALRGRFQPHWHEERYRLAVENKDFFGARYHLTERVRNIPTDFEAVVKLATSDRIVAAVDLVKAGQMLNGSKVYSSAADAFRQAYEFVPDYLTAQRRGYAHCDAGEPFKGYQSFDRALCENRFWNRDDIAESHLAMMALRASLGRAGTRLDAAERDTIRRRAIDLMECELDKVKGWVASNEEVKLATAKRSLAHWLRDADLAPVRLGFPVPGMPKEERERWTRSWAGVRKVNSTLK